MNFKITSDTVKIVGSCEGKFVKTDQLTGNIYKVHIQLKRKNTKKMQFITELIDLSNQSHGSPTTGVWSSCYYTSSVIFSAINGGICYIKLKIPISTKLNFIFSFSFCSQVTDVTCGKSKCGRLRSAGLPRLSPEMEILCPVVRGTLARWQWWSSGHFWMS